MLVDNSSLNRKLEAYTVLITFVFTSETIFQFAISILRSFAYRYAEIIGFPLVFYLGSYNFLPTSWSLVPSVFVCLFFQIVAKLVLLAIDSDLSSMTFWSCNPKSCPSLILYSHSTYHSENNLNDASMYLFFFVSFHQCVNSMKMKALPILFTIESSGLRIVFNTYVGI